LKVPPRIIVSVTSDLVTDQRVNRNCLALRDQGFQVLLVGRELPESGPVGERPYEVKRLRLLFTKGPLFYASYNLSLFFFLLFNKANALFANDLDTLTANWLASVIKKIPLIYDSHEYFTGVPEIQNRPFVKGAWQRIERLIFPKLKTIITVNDSIAGLYRKEYGKQLVVIRNIPLKPNLPQLKGSITEERVRLGMPAAKNIIILQRSGINIDRGSEEAVLAMKYVNNAVLLILGGGDVMPLLRKLVSENHLGDKVIFKNRMPYVNMMEHTRLCDLGLTLDKDTNINYRFSLPNKVFDYIHAGIPILATRLPEVERIVKGYEVGDFTESHQPEAIATAINSMLNDSLKVAQWKKNLQIASQELTWKMESKKFPNIIHGLQS
jgi:glycosyltransferase involved in cell wall biosynthesis